MHEGPKVIDFGHDGGGMRGCGARLARRSLVRARGKMRVDVCGNNRRCSKIVTSSSSTRGSETYASWRRQARRHCHQLADGVSHWRWVNGRMQQALTPGRCRNAMTSVQVNSGAVAQGGIARLICIYSMGRECLTRRLEAAHAVVQQVLYGC
jgi:hypothetical protein